jgi:hypothetical protein
VLNSRQTDIQTVQTILHVVSSVLRNGLHINTDIMLQKCGWGAAGTRGGGGPWLWTCGHHWTFKERSLVLWSARDGRFDGDRSLGGGG